MKPRPPQSEPTADVTVAQPVPLVGARARYPFLAPPQLPDEIGRLGPYRVLAELGHGGMGIVFRAEETQLKRLVALKVMLPVAAANPRARVRFVREARAQAKVEHDHIIVIYQVGEAGDVPFIAMPLLKGQTVAAALKQNPRPPLAELVRIGREIAEGLAAAHAVGLIHRDIKPGNIWLEAPKRRVKILDFGLAREEVPDPDETNELITTSGQVMGTPAYMAPEQARSRPTDPRTDLFSLGVVLYQMATGQKPFTGGNAFDVMTAVVERVPAPARELVTEVPPALSALIERLMAKNPTERPASATEVAEELAEIGRGLAGLPVRVIPVGAVPGAPNPWEDLDVAQIDQTGSSAVGAEKPAHTNRARWPWAVGAVLGAVLVGGLVWLAADSLKPKPPAAVEEPKEKEKEKEKEKNKIEIKKPLPATDAFFDIRDKRRWTANPDEQWTVTDGPLGLTVSASRGLGQPLPSLQGHQNYTNFELSFTLWRNIRGPGGSSVILWFRRPAVGGEPGVIKFTNTRVWFGALYNASSPSNADQEMKIRCDGCRVTITAGPSTLVDDVFDEHSTEGHFKLQFIGEQITGEIKFKNIQFRDLSTKP